mgnify:CR=1 FL=1
MYIGVAGETVEISVRAAVGSLMRRDRMTRQAELRQWLFQQFVVFAAMRIMAFHTAATLNLICVGGRVFITMRSRDLAVTIFTNSRKTISLILIGAFGKLVAAQTGHCSLKHRVIGTTHESESIHLMTATTEIAVIIKEQSHHWRRSVKSVAARAIQLLECMGVIPVGIHILMGEMAGGTRQKRFVA